ncbi:hypothetical protein D9M71_693140 [compost metagenome]
MVRKRSVANDHYRPKAARRIRKKTAILPHLQLSNLALRRFCRHQMNSHCRAMRSVQVGAPYASRSILLPSLLLVVPAA